MPANESAGESKYVPFNVVESGLNVPEPSVVQTPLVLPPEIVPFKDAEIAPGQIPKLLPAFTIGPGSMVTATSKLSAAHPTEAAITFVSCMCLPCLIAS